MEYRQLTPAQLDRLQVNPDAIEGFIEEFDIDEDFEDVFDDEDDDDFEDEEGGRGSDDDESDDEDEDEDEFGAKKVGGGTYGEMGKYFSLDKSWHAIHYMLNGHPSQGAGPLFDAVLGGTEVGEDMGYGPARVLTPDEVRAVATALSKVNRDELKKKFDLKAMKDAKVYVGDYDFKELNARLKELNNFFEEASENGNAMLLSIQ